MVTRILIMAGGTGGHVFPALAVAEALREAGAEIVWLGTRRGLEARVVPRAGIDMEWLSVTGLRHKGVRSWLLAPFNIAVALAQSLAVMLRRRPMVVLGMGGYATGPGGVMSWLLRVPLLIHEQNAVAGLTNRLLARLATGILAAFPNTFPPRLHAAEVGNPVRAALTDLPEPRQRLQGHSGALRLLVIGGSLGAQVLNEAVPRAVQRLDAAVRPQIWHQTGERHLAAAQAAYAGCGVTAARIVPFIEDMAEAYGWADVVVCRAGALTVAELAATGIGAILVPYPHAVDDHQTRNAAFLVEAGAAILVPQTQLTPEYLAQLLEQFTGADRRQRLLDMAQAARRLARPDAARRIATLCLEAAHG
jgi:UDP-N-acetylglucosamine--N-acetylmuramyl-(pentapeptide) pyrophosphoryl-undecaprenol N-acetylglucosamine transferase